MAKQLSMNYTDTAISGGVAPSISVPQLNYRADFRVTVDEPSEAKITNITSPLDMPERFRFAHNSIADVYRNTGIDPTLYYQSRRGTQILCQLTDVYSVTDSLDPTYLALLPVESHLVFRVPNNPLITPTVLKGLIGRNIAGLFDPSTTGDSRLAGMLRGSLLPTAL